MEYIILIKENQKVFKIDVADVNLEVSALSIHELVSDDYLITYQPDELICFLGLEGIRNTNILDFECIDKQIRQSVGLDAVEGKWSVTNMLFTYVNKSKKIWQEEEYEDFLKNLTLCYKEMKKLGKEEWDRIVKIEIPVNKILYEVQFEGIFFNSELTNLKCEELHRELYRFKNRIQLDLNFVGDDLISYLTFNRIEHNLNNDSCDMEFKDFCLNSHPTLEPFWRIRETYRDLKCLLFLSASGRELNLCKPIFKGFASSTGRIFLRDPALQHLRKKFRVLLKDELNADWRFEYIDYGQFEAGILASVSKNDKLQKLYEEDKLYECLATMTNSDRDTAKIIFYRFVYGGIAKGAEKFFETYNLKNTVDTIVNRAIENGFVSTVFGNRRKIVDKKDKSWILNHYIQGTSSLIFKQALINVKNTFQDKVKLVLPIHDAALFKVHKDISTDKIMEQFIKAFVQWIPESKPVVKEKNFFEEV